VTVRERGLTLVELMVVVAIVGILLTAFAMSFGGRKPVPEAAQDLSLRLREAARLAISGGVVDQALAEDAPTTARTRIRIRYDSSNEIQLVTVEIRNEAEAAGAEWFVVSESAVPGGATIHAFEAALRYSPTGWGAAYGGAITGSPTFTVLRGPHATGASTADISFYCRPDGGCDAVTLFVASHGTSQKRRMRVVMMPLQGSPIVFDGW
jgi:prepilin-type N-terminal cleavage/methylation domain-containing protein